MAANFMNDFKRDISYRVSLDENRIRLTATMADRYHDIVLEAMVNLDTLVIEGLTAEFRRCPENECHRSGERLGLLIGTVIGKGLTRRINESMGGEEGCGNLRNLLLGLLPLAVNARAAAGFEDEESMLENIRTQLTGTCAGYPRHTA